MRILASLDDAYALFPDDLLLLKLRLPSSELQRDPPDTVQTVAKCRRQAVFQGGISITAVSSSRSTLGHAISG